MAILLYALFIISRGTAAAAAAAGGRARASSSVRLLSSPLVLIYFRFCQGHVSGRRLARGRCSGLSVPRRGTRVHTTEISAARCTWNTGISIFFGAHTHTHTSAIHRYTCRVSSCVCVCPFVVCARLCECTRASSSLCPGGSGTASPAAPGLEIAPTRGPSRVFLYGR